MADGDPPIVAEAPMASAVVQPEAAPAAAPAVAALERPVDIPSALDSAGREPLKVEVEPIAEVKAEEKPTEVVVEEKIEEAVEAKADDKPVEEKKADDDGKTKVEEPPKEGEPKTEEPKAEDKPVEPPKPDPVDYKFTIPEIITMDDAQKGEFTGALDEFRANPAEGAQKLIDLHVKSLEAHAAAVERNQYAVFNQTRADWNKQAMADPEFGGSGYQTSLSQVARVRDAVISDHKPGTKGHDADLKAFNEACRITGCGDHPVILKMFKRMSKFMAEPAPSPPGGKPPPNNGTNPNRSRAERMYDRTNFGRKAS